MKPAKKKKKKSEKQTQINPIPARSSPLGMFALLALSRPSSPGEHT